MRSANHSAPLQGLRLYQALLGLSQAAGLAGGFDSGRNFMKHSQEEYWRPRFHAPPLRSHPDPPPTIQCSWYPHEGQCPYMRLALICWRSNGECTFTDMQKIEKRGEKRV